MYAGVLRIIQWVAVATALSWAPAAGAATLRYDMSFMALGFFEGQAFDSRLVTFWGESDTGAIENGAPEIYRIYGIPASVTIAGLGSARMTDTFQLAANQRDDRIGLVNLTNLAATVYLPIDNLTYDLSASFGAVSGPTYSSGGRVETDRGALSFRILGPVTYRAVVGGVPEPESWALMIGGFGLAGLALRRRKLKILPRTGRWPEAPEGASSTEPPPTPC